MQTFETLKETKEIDELAQKFRGYRFPYGTYICCGKILLKPEETLSSVLNGPNKPRLLNKPKWDIQGLAKAVDHFIEKNSREPRRADFEADPLLPSSHMVRRAFGGFKIMRKVMGFSEIDETTGEHRSQKAKFLVQQARTMEAQIFNKLYKKYNTGLDTDHIVIVSRQFQYQQYIPETEDSPETYSETSVDMAISDYKKKHVILIDIFHPADIHSLHGCVAVKRKKTEKNPVHLTPGSTHDLYFVCTNPNISQEEIDRIIKPHPMYKTLSYSTFCRDILDA